LAKVSGARADDYTATYPGVVSRMKTSRTYPMTFMRMNPDRSRQRNRDESHRPRKMTDGESSAGYAGMCRALTEM
jgi:hypothetical protein